MRSPLLHRTRRRWLIGLPVAAGAVTILALPAIAYWTSGGGGSGSGTTGQLQPVTVAAFVGGDATSSFLIPGGSADVILRLSNPNAFAVTLVSVTGNGTIVPDGAHAACTTTGVTFTDQTAPTVNIPAGSTLVDLPAAASMSVASSNGCQGATFGIPVSVTVHR